MINSCETKALLAKSCPILATASCTLFSLTVYCLVQELGVNVGQRRLANCSLAYCFLYQMDPKALGTLGANKRVYKLRAQLSFGPVR